MATEDRTIAQKVLQNNKDHQYALKVYTERLEAELQTVDKFLALADVEDEAEEDNPPEGQGSIQIPGAIRPLGILSASELLSESSPFYEDSARRQRYLTATESHPMSLKEHEALAEAVRMENYRLYAYEAQRRGLPPFFSAHDQPQNLELNKDGIDWDRVADKVNTSIGSTGTRTALECQIRWLGNRHPQYNHTQWTFQEVTKAKDLIADIPRGQIDWIDIADQLGTQRTAMDVMRRAVPRAVHVWDRDADERLLDAVKVYGVENWSLVARQVSEDVTPAQCQNRYYRSLDPSLRRGNWVDEEDTRLRQAVALFGNSWVDVASVMPGRNNEQCRDRWSERLNPNVAKGKWTPEEDAKMLAAVEELGDATWKAVSEKLGTGRTDNMCRHRYQLITKKRREKPTSIAGEHAKTPSPHTNTTEAPDIASTSTAIPQQAPAADVSPSEVDIVSDEPPPVRKRKPRARPINKIPAAELAEKRAALSVGDSSTPMLVDTATQAASKPRARRRKSKQVDATVPGTPTDEVTISETARPEVASAEDPSPSVAPPRTLPHPRARPRKKVAEPSEVSQPGPTGGSNGGEPGQATPNSAIIPNMSHIGADSYGEPAIAETGTQAQHEEESIVLPHPRSSKSKGKKKAGPPSLNTTALPVDTSKAGRKSRKRPASDETALPNSEPPKRRRVPARGAELSTKTGSPADNHGVLTSHDDTQNAGDESIVAEQASSPPSPRKGKTPRKTNTAPTRRQPSRGVRGNATSDLNSTEAQSSGNKCDVTELSDLSSVE